MKISGEYLFEGPQELVWELLMDPGVLASVLPGCEKLEQTGDNEYQGTLEIRIGPVQGKFKGKVQLEDIREPDTYTMKVHGEGASGFVDAIGRLALASEDGNTRVTYEGDANVGGRLAAVGQRLVESSAKSIIRQSLQGLNAAVMARAGGSDSSGSGGETSAADTDAEPRGLDTSPTPAAGATASSKRPSQTRFAARVAGDVFRDILPRPIQWGLGGIVVCILLVILYLLFVG